MRRNIMAVSFAALCLATPVAAPASAKPLAGTAAGDAALEGQVRAALARELGPATRGAHGGGPERGRDFGRLRG